MSNPQDATYKELNDYFVSTLKHGHWPKWREAINRISDFKLQATLVDADEITFNTNIEFCAASLENQLMVLKPWRKGPFSINALKIDSEWQCQFKWDRIKNLTDWNRKGVIDIGSGNGYFAMKAFLAGANQIVALDPTEMFLAQFMGLNAILDEESRPNIHFMPATLEDWVAKCSALAEKPQFDVALSMGVLYHRRDPHQHLNEIKQTLKPNGELILETLVQHEEKIIFPQNGRYCGMPNVHALPSIPLLIEWLEAAGFIDIKLHDQSQTRVGEQRATRWSGQFSLIDRLDRDDSSKTIEHLPAPIRAIIHARI